jgi:hypothetical protein
MRKKKTKDERRKTKKTKALAYRENLFILFDGLAWRGLRPVLFLLLLLLPHLFTYTTRFCFVLLLCLVLFFFFLSSFFLLSSSKNCIVRTHIFGCCYHTSPRRNEDGKPLLSLLSSLRSLISLSFVALLLFSSPFFFTCDFFLAFCCAVHEGENRWV